MAGQATNVEDLWKRAEDFAKLTASPRIAADAPVKMQSERLPLWSKLSQLSPSDQAVLMSRLSSSWPFAMERRALNWPVKASMLANCITSTLISTRITADLVMYNARMPFLETIRTGPKSPFVFGVYTSGITFYMLHLMTVTPSIYAEASPCSSCLLVKSCAIGITTGIVLPMISTPFLSYYVHLQRQGGKFPEVKNTLEFLMLSIEGSRSARPLFKTLIPLQILVASAGVFVELWGRERFFGTLDADEELAKQLMTTAVSQRTLKERVKEWMSYLPFFGTILDETPPEQEKLPSL